MLNLQKRFLLRSALAYSQSCLALLRRPHLNLSHFLIRVVWGPQNTKTTEVTGASSVWSGNVLKFVPNEMAASFFLAPPECFSDSVWLAVLVHTYCLWICVQFSQRAYYVLTTRLPVMTSSLHLP